MREFGTMRSKFELDWRVLALIIRGLDNEIIQRENRYIEFDFKIFNS